MNDKQHFTIKIAKRAWYEWALWAIWALGLLFILQNALTSGAELEPRAATIFWITFAVWLLGGVIVWFIRSNKQSTSTG